MKYHKKKGVPIIELSTFEVFLLFANFPNHFYKNDYIMAENYTDDDDWAGICAEDFLDSAYNIPEMFRQLEEWGPFEIWDATKEQATSIETFLNECKSYIQTKTTIQ